MTKVFSTHLRHIQVLGRLDSDNTHYSQTSSLVTMTCFDNWQHRGPQGDLTWWGMYARIGAQRLRRPTGTLTTRAKIFIWKDPVCAYMRMCNVQCEMLRSYSVSFHGPFLSLSQSTLNFITYKEMHSLKCQFNSLLMITPMFLACSRACARASYINS